MVEHDANKPVVKTENIVFAALNFLIDWLAALPGLRRFGVLPQFFRFCTVGIFNTVIDFSIYFSLTRIWWYFDQHYLQANFFAFLLANLFSFWANKNWTFKNFDQHRFSQYGKFFSTSILALLSIQLTMYLGVSILGWWDLAVKILALLVSVLINFFGAKFWAFK